MLRILLVHGFARERAKLASMLVAAGFKVITASGSASGLRKFYEACPGLVIMAGELTSVNNEELCSRLREVTDVPIIVLGKGDEVVRMLELGADAYLVTPVSTAILIARVRSLLRRCKGRELREDEPLCPQSFPSLTSMEIRILNCLLRSRGRVVFYPQLITEVWGNRTASLDTLHYYMRRLRRKVANGAISQLRSIGYCFCANGDGGYAISNMGKEVMFKVKEAGEQSGCGEAPDRRTEKSEARRNKETRIRRKQC